MLTIPMNYTALGGTYDVMTGAAKGTQVFGQDPLWLAWVTDLVNLKGTDAAQYQHLLDIYQAVECLGKTGQLFGFHEHPNPDCPIGNSIHGVLDGKLEEIQLAMEKEMAQTSLKEVVEQTKKQMELASVS